MVVQATAQQYRYTQKELDPDAVGFNSDNRRYQFPLRFYIPTRGQFAQVDPLVGLGLPGVEMTLGKYIYVAHNPVRFVDPAGAAGISATPTCTDCFPIYGYGESFTRYLVGGWRSGMVDFPRNEDDPYDPYFHRTLEEAKRKALKDAFDKVSKACSGCTQGAWQFCGSVPLNEEDFAGAVCTVQHKWEEGANMRTGRSVDTIKYTIKCKAWIYVECQCGQKGMGAGDILPIGIVGGAKHAFVELLTTLFAEWVKEQAEGHEHEK
jgi:RHS repeat-associated protein